MFDHCIWYSITDKILTDNIKILSDYLKIKPLYPHITLKWYMDDKISNHIYLEIKNDKIPMFVKSGEPYQTKTDNFFALQQDYFKINDCNRKYHISLAYRIDKEFTEDEINFARKLIYPNILNESQITVERWLCNCLDHSKWKLLNN